MEDKKNRRPNTPRETQREIFLREIGHTADGCIEFLADGDPNSKEQREYARVRHACYSAGQVGDHCGWWWCPDFGEIEDADDQRWGELRIALKALRQHQPSVDPWYGVVREILLELDGLAGGYKAVKKRLREEYESLKRVAKEAARLPDRIREDVLAQHVGPGHKREDVLRVWIRSYEAVGPHGHDQRGITPWQHRALRVGRNYEMSSTTVAAILFLAGVHLGREKERKEEDEHLTFGSWADSIRKLEKRTAKEIAPKKRAAGAMRGWKKRRASISVKRAARRAR